LVEAGQQALQRSQVPVFGDLPPFVLEPPLSEQAAGPNEPPPTKAQASGTDDETEKRHSRRHRRHPNLAVAECELQLS